jgi:class 3 adenylate cyclase
MNSAAATGYMVLQDLRATHTRRVRMMVLVSCLLLVLLGLGWTGFFVLRAQWPVAAAEFSLVLVGGAGALLTRRGKLRAATVLLSVSLFIVFVAMAALLDLPSAQVPRATHHFLIPLAVASYLMLKGESAWLQHGIPLACLAAVVFFTDTGFGIATPYAVSDDVRQLGTWVNNLSAVAVMYLLVHVFMGDINRMESYLHSANNRFVGLVRGMFPRVIAERLLASGQTFAERHANCSILFADIVGFTGITERMAPEALVGMLSDIFSRFDGCVERMGLTKIKTIGDAYMVAAGVPEPNPRHAAILIELAQQMQREIGGFEGLQLRIGVASGELVAGVIGQSRQVFDVWGDVVNVASRMESHGLPGRVQVSESCYLLVKEQFEFEQRPAVAIKGKSGTHKVYMLRSA